MTIIIFSTRGPGANRKYWTKHDTWLVRYLEENWCIIIPYTYCVIGQDKVFFRLQLFEVWLWNLDALIWVRNLQGLQDELQGGNQEGLSGMIMDDFKGQMDKGRLFKNTLSFLSFNGCWLPIAHYFHLKSHVHGIRTGTWELACHFKKQMFCLIIIIFCCPYQIKYQTPPNLYTHLLKQIWDLLKPSFSQQ